MTAPHASAPRVRPDSGASGLPVWAWVLVVGAGVGVAYIGRGLLLPVLLALLGAYFLNPVVLRLQERGVARGPAVGLLFASFGLGVVLALYLLFPTLQGEGRRLVAQAPAFATRIEASLDATAADVRTRWPATARLLPEPQEPGWLLKAIDARVGAASELAGRAGEILLVVMLAPAFAFFMLRDGPGVVHWIILRIHPRHIETSVAVWAEIDRIIGQYLRGLIIESVGVGMLASIGLRFLGVPFPLLIGLFAAVVNPLPYIGVVLSLSVAALVALTSQMGFATLGSVVVLFGVIRLLDDLVLIPITIGGAVHLHPALVIASILIGEHALGVLGMVLAVPTVTVLKEVASLLLEHRRTLAGRGSHWATPYESGHLPL